jgi:integrase
LGELASPHVRGRARGRRRGERAPYDLRHSFASLLLAEGRTIHYVAKQLGHSALMTLNTYGHVIDELEDDVRVDPEKEIVRARGAVPASYLSGA